MEPCPPLLLYTDIVRQGIVIPLGQFVITQYDQQVE